MATHLAKIDHSNSTPYQDGNLLPLASEGTDAYVVHTFEGLPTHQGGSSVMCPTIRRQLSSTADGPFLGTSFYSLSAFWDNNGLTLLPVMLHWNTILISTVISGNRTYTLPSAAVLIAFLNKSTHSPLLGGTFWSLKIGVDGGFTLTLAPGVGSTVRGNVTNLVIASGTTRGIGIRLTNIIPGTEAYELYIF